MAPFNPSVKIRSPKKTLKVHRPFRIDNPQGEFIDLAWLNRLLNTQTEFNKEQKDLVRRLFFQRYKDDYAFGDAAAFIRKIGNIEDIELKQIRNLFLKTFEPDDDDDKPPPDDDEDPKMGKFQQIATKWALGRDPRALQEFLKAAKANDFSNQEANNFGRFLSQGLAEGKPIFMGTGPGLFDIGLEGIKQGFNMAGSWNSPFATHMFHDSILGAATTDQWFSMFGNRLGQLGGKDDKPPPDDDDKPPPDDDLGVRLPTRAPLQGSLMREAQTRPMGQVFVAQPRTIPTGSTMFPSMTQTRMAQPLTPQTPNIAQQATQTAQSLFGPIARSPIPQTQTQSGLQPSFSNVFSSASNPFLRRGVGF